MSQIDIIRSLLATGPQRPRQLLESLGVSQPTLSRLIRALGNEVVRIGAARSIQYVLRDNLRGLPDISIFRVDSQGSIRELGILIPVRPEGYIMRQTDGTTLHSDGLPWWLDDMRPQGYLGRAYVAAHSFALGLPSSLTEWNDTHTLRALITHGHDAVGNLLLEEAMRERFLSIPDSMPIAAGEKGDAYERRIQDVTSGESPGSSAGGEQPKFTAYAETSDGPRHLIVKFTETETSSISERWRDLLLAEHLAMECLHDSGIAASRTEILDTGARRYLEIERFDRIGIRGRRGMLSLAALDAEFVGSGTGNWPRIVRELVNTHIVEPSAFEQACFLWAFGTLIGNTDMHNGNLSFMTDHGRPYQLAPAYDMTPMAFSPTTGGGMRNNVNAPTISSNVPNDIWRHALAIAKRYMERVHSNTQFSPGFIPAMQALEVHIEAAAGMIARLG